MENVWSPAEPGQNVVLTIDLDIQQAAERALLVFGPGTRGAVVVMNATNGDVLAMASAPTLDPNWFVRGCTHEEWQRISEFAGGKKSGDAGELRARLGFQDGGGNGSAGSRAGPEQGIGRAAQSQRPRPWLLYASQPSDSATLRRPGATISNGRSRVRATPISLLKAFSSPVRSRLCGSASACILGSGWGCAPARRRGAFSRAWTKSTTAGQTAIRRTCAIGQDPVLVTPLQIAVLMSAIGNGGKVFYPRLVERIDPQDPLFGQASVAFESGRVRDELGVSKRTLAILHDAMLARHRRRQKAPVGRAACSGHADLRQDWHSASSGRA